MLRKKQFIILMNGFTATGKSTVASKITKSLNCEIFHSAVVRRELGLSPSKKDADKFFDYRNKLRQNVDRKVYGEIAKKAEIALKKGRCVICDCGYFLKWQRKQIYKIAKKYDIPTYILRIICEDENEIKRRLIKRYNQFDDSPLHETPSWNTYLSTKEIYENPINEYPPIIEHSTLTNKLKIIKGNKKDNITKMIIQALKSQKL